MPNFVGSFPLLKIIASCFQAVKYMIVYLSTITWVCFSQLECAIYGMHVFLKRPFLVHSQPHLTDGEKTVLFRRESCGFARTINNFTDS